MGGTPSVSNPVMKKQLDALVAANEVVVFGTSGCPFCTRAQKLFVDELGLGSGKYAYHDINRMRNGDAIFNEVTLAHNGHDTVPAVFILGKFVGGYTEVSRLHRGGKLTDILGIAPKK